MTPTHTSSFGDAAAASTAATALPPRALRSIRLMGVRLEVVTERQAVEHVLAELGGGRGGQVVTVNLDILRRCDRDPSFREHVNRAPLVVADGMPLVWVSRVRGTPLPERVAGSSMVGSLAVAAAGAGRSIFLLGGAPGAAEGAMDTLRKTAPGLQVVGAYCPAFGFEKDPGELRRIEDALAAASPDIVYVALGSPKQEHLIERLRPMFPNAWFLGVGISLGFLSGQVKRAPRLVQAAGLEWVHRLVQEPRRLARRYLVDGIPFAIRLAGRSVVERFTGGREKAGPDASRQA